MESNIRPADATFNKTFKKICKKHKLIDPVELLVGLSNGVDLTTTSAAFDYVKNLRDEYGDDMPSEIEYLELLKIIEESNINVLVDTQTRLAAQKTLVEYQFPKRKSVELITENIDGKVTKLTARESKIFMRKFNDKY